MSWTRSPYAKQWQSEFGVRLRELRSAKGLSQLELANLADLDPTYISAVEQGRRNITLVNIRALAQALGVDPVKLFEAEQSPSASAGADE